MPSSADNPDLDWSQVRETVLMLNLAVAQISSTLVEGDDSIAKLADTFTSMVGNVETVNMAASQLADSTEKQTIAENCASVLNEMQRAIISFQFYDKLSQRLSHVSNSLNVLGNLVSDPNKLYNPYEWKGLQEKIKSKYTVESDRIMFEYILKGHTIEQALELANQSAPSDTGEDVELF
jgi:hypothetical protein